MVNAYPGIGCATDARAARTGVTRASARKTVGEWKIASNATTEPASMHFTNAMDIMM